jgi:hypothetical protein
MTESCIPQLEYPNARLPHSGLLCCAVLSNIAIPFSAVIMLHELPLRV